MSLYSKKEDVFFGAPKIINLTRHKIVYIKDGEVIKSFEPSGLEARCFTSTDIVARVGGVIIERTKKESVTDLPRFSKGRYLIVSHRVRSVFPGRKDLISPAQLVKEGGKIIGCRKFVSN